MSRDGALTQLLDDHEGFIVLPSLFVTLNQRLESHES
jgi:hypothetical protein